MAQVNKLFILLPDEFSSVNSVIAEGESVHAGMTANATTFSSPPNSMADFLIGLNLLKDAVVPAREKNTITTETMQKRKVDFINNFLVPNSTYVLSVANGDRYIASLSGHRLNKDQREPRPVGPFSAEYLGVGPAPGTARIRINERAGCAVFIVALQEAGGAYRVLDGYNTLEFVVEELPSGQSTLRIHGKKGEIPSPYVYVVAWAV